VCRELSNITTSGVSPVIKSFVKTTTRAFSAALSHSSRAENALAGCGKSEDFALLAGVRERIRSARKVFFRTPFKTSDTKLVGISMNMQGL
jgi:hypothetical protein